jgi:hypothetical protein
MTGEAVAVLTMFVVAVVAFGLMVWWLLRDEL